jgi:Archaeal/vacuolar-type H+-ATPase subunit C
MDNTIFAQSVGRIRALERNLLSKQKVEELILAENFSDCIRMLQNSLYGQYTSTGSYEEGLRIAVQDLYRDMYKIVPLKSVVDILAVRYDVHNIKCLIKGRLAGKDVNGLLINAGSISTEDLKGFMEDKNLKGMPGVLAGSVNRALETYKSSQDPQDIDIEMDKGMFQYMQSIAKDSGLEFLGQLTELYIDVTNIKSFIRLYAQKREEDILRKIFIRGGRLEYNLLAGFINSPLDRFAGKMLYTQYDKWSGCIGDYIKTGDLSLIERFGDNYILDNLRKAKYISFGPEPLIAYIIARENEIKILRIILTGKKNGVLPEAIRERLRDVYV